MACGARLSALGIALTCVAGPAFADDAPAVASPEESNADALFDQGRVLLEQGNAKAALEKFEASNTVEPSAGTFLNMGQCLEAMGKTESAFEAYRHAIDLGKSTNKPRHVEAAEKYIEALEPRLTKLSLRAVSPPTGLHVVAKNEAGDSFVLRDHPITVNPGSFTVEASAPGFKTWSSTIDAKGTGEVAIDVPLLEADTPKSKPGFHPDALFNAGTVTAGAGLVGIAVGTAFGVITLNDVDTAETDPKLCPHFRCTRAGEAWIDGTTNESTTSTVALTLGVAAAVAGGVMITWSLLHRPTEGASETALMAVPTFVTTPRGGTYVGLTVRGTL